MRPSPHLGSAGVTPVRFLVQLVFSDFSDQGLSLKGGFGGLNGEFVVSQRKLYGIPLAHLDLPGEPGGDAQSQAVSPFL